MLINLHVKNLALIEETGVDFTCRMPITPTPPWSMAGSTA